MKSPLFYFKISFADGTSALGSVAVVSAGAVVVS
ncbi:hypothetical protein SMU76_04012, partial [Streptococcus mutans N66]